MISVLSKRRAVSLSKLRCMAEGTERAARQRFKSTDSTDKNPPAGDSIKLVDMVFYGYHGVLPEEKTLGQRFSVDVTVYRDLRAAGVSDALGDTSDFGLVYRQVKDVMEGKSYNLLEAAAERIASNILEEDKAVAAVQLEIRKPSVPIPGALGASAVSIVRHQR